MPALAVVLRLVNTGQHVAAGDDTRGGIAPLSTGIAWSNLRFY